MLTQINDAIARAFLFGAALLAFLLCFLVVGDVLGRVLLGAPIKGTPEIVSTSIVIICYLQAGYAIRSGGMLNVDALVKHLPAAGQSWMAAMGALLGAAFFAFLCWGSFEPALHAWQSNEFEGEGALRVPAWPTRGALLVGTALAASSYIVTLIENTKLALAGKAPAASTATH